MNKTTWFGPRSRYLLAIQRHQQQQHQQFDYLATASFREMAEPSLKRRRLSSDAVLASLSRPISPPRKKAKETARIASPFRLTSIRDLPESDNVGAVSLNDLIGDPMIAELWDFNYLHDLDFLMEHLDEDTRALTQVHVVHGFWKREDPNRLMLQEQAGQHKNVTLHTAHMPEMFGTHHSKMLILLRHDDMAQVIIHTANMIAKDWTNMTNGVWISPLLPKLASSSEPAKMHGPMGSGSRFKFDLLSYLRAYNKVRNVCGPLVEKIESYDFSAVRGALVASVPGKHDVEQEPDTIRTRWGWQGLREALKSVPVQNCASDIVVQISSIATLGANDTWLQRTLFNSLCTSSSLFPSATNSQPTTTNRPKPNLKIIFPTPDEIRKSLDGYLSGASIHTKTQSAAQTKQLQYLRPLFHHWANDSIAGVSTPTLGSTSTSQTASAAISSNASHPKKAGRRRAAPHIKTYIRYNTKSIDWALLTSANISKQAWGEAMNSAGEVRVASWEIGVLVWPALLADGDPTAKMVGVFGTDDPPPADKEDGTGTGRTSSGSSGDDGGAPVVGLRIPYDLPLQKYGPTEAPWVATMGYTEPDRMGRMWPGY